MANFIEIDKYIINLDNVAVISVEEDEEGTFVIEIIFIDGGLILSPPRKYSHREIAKHEAQCIARGSYNTIKELYEKVNSNVILIEDKKDGVISIEG